MLKKLDRLILKSFIGPFVAVFFLTLLVLILQFFWLWIDDFVGKGLSAGLIMEFIWFQSAVLVPLALPLAVLLASLMTFGNLGETFELVAIKSSGISLLRFMRPLFVLSLIICGIAFLFSNFIIPVAVLKSRTMLADIVWAKPSFDLQEGVFYDKIDGFAIKVGKKEADSIIKDVIIFERGQNILQDNFIVAKSGTMRSSDNKRFLELHLKEGWRYQERGDRINPNTEFIRIGFKEYTKQLDLSSLGLRQRTSDTVNRNNQRMQSIRQLSKTIDSLKDDSRKYAEKVKREVFSFFNFSNLLDSPHTKPVVKLDSSVHRLEDLIPDSAIRHVNKEAANMVSTITLNTEIANSEFLAKQRTLRLHQIEWHKKLALSAACLVLFLIGAPLGSIIRKGGIGTPLVFAVFLFMFYFFLSTAGEKSVKQNAMTPFGGMWMATMLCIPIGVFLSFKAMHDSQLFNKEFYFRFWKGFGRLVRTAGKRLIKTKTD